MQMTTAEGSMIKPTDLKDWDCSLHMDTCTCMNEVNDRVML